MIPLSFVLSAALAASIFGNAGLLFKLTRTKGKKPESMELQEFLMDLRTGWAVLSVKRVDPNDIMIRSPRQR